MGSTADDLFSTMAECASCGALNTAGTRVCDECGERIPRGERARTETTTQRRVRLGATRELQDVRRNLRRVRAIYLWIAIVAIFGALLAVALTAASPVGLGPEVPVVLAPFLAMFALAMIARRQVFQQPLLWSVLVAALSIMSVAFGGGIGDLVVAGLSLWAVFVVVRTRDVFAEYGDIWDDMVARAGDGARSAGATSRRRPDLVDAHRARVGADSTASARARRRAGSPWPLRLGVAALLVGALTVAVVVKVAAGAPSAIDEPLAAFEEAWSVGDVAGIGAHFATDRRARMERSVARTFERRDWSSPPPLTRGEVDARDDGRAAIVHHGTARGDLRTNWRYDGRWILRGISFPPRDDR